MIAPRLIQKLEALGGLVFLDGDKIRLKTPAGALTTQLKDEFLRNKPEVLTYLRQKNDESEATLDASMKRQQEMNIALRIESAELGTVWLVSSERHRYLADTGDPTYTFVDARFLVRLPLSEARFVNSFVRQFKGTVEFKKTQIEGEK